MTTSAHNVSHCQYCSTVIATLLPFTVQCYSSIPPVLGMQDWRIVAAFADLSSFIISSIDISLFCIFSS